jgi:hypothetical protein
MPELLTRSHVQKQHEEILVHLAAIGKPTRVFLLVRLFSCGDTRL